MDTAASIAHTALYGFIAIAALLAVSVVVQSIASARTVRDLTDKLVGMAEPRVLEPLLAHRASPTRPARPRALDDAPAQPGPPSSAWSEDHAADFGTGV